MKYKIMTDVVTNHGHVSLHTIRLLFARSWMNSRPMRWEYTKSLESSHDFINLEAEGLCFQHMLYIHNSDMLQPQPSFKIQMTGRSETTQWCYCCWWWSWWTWYIVPAKSVLPLKPTYPIDWCLTKISIRSNPTVHETVTIGRYDNVPFVMLVS